MLIRFKYSNEVNFHAEICFCLDVDGDSSSKLSPCESLKQLAVHCSCDDNKSNKFGTQEDFKGKLELIWKKATELCQSKSLKSFLRKQGKMLSLHVNQGTHLWYFIDYTYRRFSVDLCLYF